jgi:hypothetical protein
MTVVAIPGALAGDRVPRRVNCTSACSSCCRADTTTPSPNLGSAMQPVKQSDTFAHSQDPDQPRPHIFAPYLDETCRLLAADRGLSDAMACASPAPPPPRRPRPACSSLSPSWSTAPQRSAQLRADLTLRTGVPESGQQPNPASGPRGRRPDAWRRHLGLLLDGLRAERAYPLPPPPLSPRLSLNPPMSPLQLIVLPGSRPVLATRSVHLLDAAPCDCQSASNLRG